MQTWPNPVLSVANGLWYLSIREYPYTHRQFKDEDIKDAIYRLLHPLSQVLITAPAPTDGRYWSVVSEHPLLLSHTYRHFKDQEVKEPFRRLL